MPGNIGAPDPGLSGGGGMSEKMAGLPMWGWLTIAAAGGIGIAVWMQYRKSGSDATESSTASSGSTLPTVEAPSGSIVGSTNTIDEGEFQTVVAQIRDLQGKVSTPTAAPLPATTSIRMTATRTLATAQWDPVPGAKSYQVTWWERWGQYPATPSVAYSQHTYKQLTKSGDQVHIRVAAVAADGTVGASKEGVKAVTW